MKKYILPFLLISSFAYGQNNSIADSLTLIMEVAVGTIYYSPISNQIIIRNKNGTQLQTLNLADYFASKIDFNYLRRDFNSLQSSALTNKYIDNPQEGQLLGYPPNESPGVLPSNASIDLFLTYSETIRNQQILIDTLFARVGRLGENPTAYYPSYAFYYDPVQFGANVTRDTTMTRYIKNNGTAAMTVSYRYAQSPTFFVVSGNTTVPAGDSIEVEFQFIRANMPSDVSYSHYLYVNHNGGAAPNRDWVDTINVTGKWIRQDAEPAFANIYVDPDCYTCNAEYRDTTTTIQDAVNKAAAGDIIAIKKGKTYNENVVITKSNITLTSYGTGAKPIITTWKELGTRTWTSANGKQLFFDYDGDGVRDAGETYTVGGDSIWYTQLTQANYYNIGNGIRVKNDGEELAPGCFVPWASEAGLAAAYYNQDGTYRVNNGTWWVNRYKKFTMPRDGIDVGKLFVYTDGSNPEDYYGTLSWIGGLDPITGETGAASELNTVSILNADYVTLYNLDIQGGKRSSVTIVNSSHVTIDSCNIQWSGTYGIGVNTQHPYYVYGGNSDYLTVKNCYIDSRDRTNTLWSHEQWYTSINGIGLYGNGYYEQVEHATIDSNYIRNWHSNIYIAQGGFFQSTNQGGSAKYCNVTNNRISGGGSAYSKPFQTVSSTEGAGIYSDPVEDALYFLFYNNIIDSANVVSQFSGGDSNYICFNTWTNAKISYNIHNNYPESNIFSFNPGYSGPPTMGGSHSDYNFIFNNTFYDVEGLVCAWDGNASTVFDNNLLVNTGQYSNGITFKNMNWKAQSYRNNIFYYPSISYTTKLVKWGTAAGIYSGVEHNITQFNAALLSEIRFPIDDNDIWTGTQLALINADYTIPVTSTKVLDKGLSIQSLLNRISDTSKNNYVITKDRLGNTITPASPNIGAIDN